MKKITLTIATLLALNVCLNAQTYSTGTVTLSTTSGLEYSAQIDITSTVVTLTLIGPDDRWLGLGLGVQSMTNNGDVVVFDGTNLTDRTFQGIGSMPVLDTNQDWSISSNNTSLGVRTLVATRALNTGEGNDYVFSTSDTSINLVWARGNGSTFNLGNHGGSNRGITSSGITLGIDDLVVDSFKIFPNPVSSLLNIKLFDNYHNSHADIYSSLGKKVYSNKLSYLQSFIDVSTLNTGIYILKITSNENTQTRRFVKY
ncbi:T9SS type A sorting domain-containing protein [Seonamhaeicola sp.]|uniref:T9SS type A sorting domain-containing protein n=1 Tax=Seonamhaeicola sp. TaxID=1912245 RepID=UPI0026175EB2|nr:T9SS type A sorting domain-containing protein [Seonamhaeicola sp.]